MANNAARRRQRDVLHRASVLEAGDVPDECLDDPTDVSIAREEQELLDRTLQSLPESYREPLVLFHREGQSVARVADLLELSTAAVKQRLSRGRQLLKSYLRG